jgi:mannose-6-phosphate isomerase-like protein (cupin superfamily)
VSYPDPTYFGDTGEVSAGAFRPAGAEPDLRFAAGGGASYLATGAATDGRFGLYRWDMPASPTGPGPHFHRTISESFFVLSGTVRLYDGDAWRDADVGDFLYVPPGGIHAFRNESGEPASMLLLFAPGAPREAYFEGIRDLPSMSEEEKAAFFLEHDNIWVEG